MAIETKFDVPFVSTLALREKQIQQNYRPIIAVHKWFARRPGSLFRALALAEFGDGPLADLYYGGRVPATGAGGYARMKLSRFGIRTSASVCASITSSSAMIPLRNNRYAVNA